MAEALFPTGCDEIVHNLTPNTTVHPFHGGQNVLCVNGNIVLAGQFITFDDLGFPGASWIVIVTGSIKLSGGGSGVGLLVGGGLQVGDVFFDVENVNTSVSTSGGGGGPGCCHAVIEGTVFARGRINLSPGRIDGAAIAVGEIDLVSGSGVRCPTCACTCAANGDCGAGGVCTADVCTAGAGASCTMNANCAPGEVCQLP
jgi:hypothetical protein